MGREGDVGLIEDARRLASCDVVVCSTNCTGRFACAFCSDGEPHDINCPWLAMPKIVAALEAAQALVEAGPPMHAYSSPFPFRCVYCLGGEVGSFSKGFHTEHVVYDPWLELCSALSDA